jgi:hypothetical protein
MAVGVDESRDHRFPAQIDALGACIRQAADIGIGPGCEKSAAGERHCFRVRIGGIHGVDIAVPKNELRLDGSAPCHGASTEGGKKIAALHRLTIVWQDEIRKSW